MDYAAMDYTSAADYVKGKQVAVVGIQKSAQDIGVEHPCTVIYKTEHWNLSDYLPWGVHLRYLFLNRFAELLFHKPGEGFLLSFLATILSPLRCGFSKFIESYIKRKLQLAKYGMVPKHSFFKDFSSCLISVPEDFYNRVDKGSIKLKKAPSFSFCKEGILVDGEAEPLKSDMVILATGFKSVLKLKVIFVSPTFQDYIAGSTNTTVPLYSVHVRYKIFLYAVEYLPFSPGDHSKASFEEIIERVLSRSREIKLGKYDKSSDVAEQHRLQSLQKAMVIQWICFTPPSTINDAEAVGAKLLLRALMHRIHTLM